MAEILENTSASNFASPQILQLSSILCNIAVELRFKIFQILHVSPDPLLSSTETARFCYDNDVENLAVMNNASEQPKTCASESVISLSSQLLATCQQLYHEALPFLYGENIVSIYTEQRICDFFHTSRDVDALGAMSIEADAWDLLREPSMDEPDIGSYDSIRNTSSPFELTHLKNAKVSAFASSLAAFRRIRLVVNAKTNDDLATDIFIVCRLLTPFLAVKDVIIALAVQRQFVQPSIECYNACRALGFQSIRLTVPDDHRSASKMTVVTRSASFDARLQIFDMAVNFAHNENAEFKWVTARRALCSALLGKVLCINAETSDSEWRSILNMIEQDLPKAYKIFENSIKTQHLKSLANIQRNHSSQLGILMVLAQHPKSQARIELVTAAKEKRVAAVNAEWESKRSPYLRALKDIRLRSKAIAEKAGYKDDS